MQLFTEGPIPMDKETKDVSKEALPYHRTKDFSQIMLKCDELLKRFLHTDKSTKSVYMTATGSAAMEAAVLNLFTKEDKLLILMGGDYGKRFRDICEIHEIPHHVIGLYYGQPLEELKLFCQRRQGFTGLLVCLHETTCGHLYDIDLISRFCREEKLTLVVDAVSTFLIDPYYMDKKRIDCTIISSHKGLGLAPGMSAVYINEKTYEKRVANNKVRSVFFDFKRYIKDMERGQSPYTPPIGVIMQLYEKLRRLRRTGINKHIEKIAEISAYTKKRVLEAGFSFPDYKISNGVTPVICDKKYNAKYIVNHLLTEYGICVLPCAGLLENSLFRIGHMTPNLEKSDIDYLMECIIKLDKEAPDRKAPLGIKLEYDEELLIDNGVW